jgi:hypothetical protein
MWPNIFAPGFWTILGIAVSHWRIRKHVNRKHDELHKKLNERDH